MVPGCPHHITQRGIRGGDVFVTDDDRRFYLAILRTYAQKHGVSIWAYCLMTNHVHFVAVPSSPQALARTFHDAHGIYSMRFNRDNNLSGNVFEGRFYSTPLDEGHLWSAVRYVERNPVRALMADSACDYPWSSARGHSGGTIDPLLAEDFPPVGIIDDWAGFLRDDTDEGIHAIRMATRTGRPCGGPEFTARVSSMVNHSFAPKKRGPKFKNRAGA